MWSCKFCDTEMNENYDYCSTCEYAGCTKNDHHCCNEYSAEEYANAMSRIYGAEEEQL